VKRWIANQGDGAAERHLAGQVRADHVLDEEQRLLALGRAHLDAAARLDAIDLRLVKPEHPHGQRDRLDGACLAIGDELDLEPQRLCAIVVEAALGPRLGQDVVETGRLVAGEVKGESGRGGERHERDA
jgi:hypothetical protein